jgi:hypothetical protein
MDATRRSSSRCPADGEAVERGDTPRPSPRSRERAPPHTVANYLRVSLS